MSPTSHRWTARAAAVSALAAAALALVATTTLVQAAGSAGAAVEAEARPVGVPLTEASPLVATTYSAATPAAAAPTATGTVERTAWLMGTEAQVRVEAETRAAALAASEAALRTMAAVEARLSTWRDDSELSRLNRTAPGTAVSPPAELAALLAELAAWAERTGNAFHPAVGALVDAWDLRGIGRLPESGDLERAVAASGARGIRIDPESGTVVRHDGAAWLDAGAFGKGAALRDAREALTARGVRSAEIDLGGQLLVVGPDPVSVSVAHPRRRSEALHRFDVTDASVATSGQAERGIEVDGRRFGHLLDPRNGRPVPAWGSVTVVHDDPVAADVLATALFVLGPDDGLRLAESLGGVAALFLIITDAGVTERMTSTMRRLHPLRSIARSISDLP